MHPKSVARAFRRLQKLHSTQSDKIGRPRVYTDDVVSALHELWKFAGCPCAELLHPMIEKYLHFLRVENRWSHSDESSKKLLKMSLGTAKRVIREFAGRERQLTESSHASAYNPKSSRLQNVAHWQNLCPGTGQLFITMLQSKSDERCRVYSISFVDAVVCWSVARCQPDLSQNSLYEALHFIRTALPYRLTAIHFETADEDACGVIERWCRSEGIEFTSIVTSARLPTTHNAGQRGPRDAAATTNEKASTTHDDFKELLTVMTLCSNYFKTRRRQVSREVLGKKVVRRYESKARTPFQRLLDHSTTSEAVKKKLTREHSQLNPVALSERLNELITDLSTRWDLQGAHRACNRHARREWKGQR
jgi:hypothetical protein